MQASKTLISQPERLVRAPKGEDWLRHDYLVKENIRSVQSVPLRLEAREASR